MHPVSTAIDSGPATAGGADPQRVLNAAREFEAVLLNTLLGSLEHSFASLPGKDPETGSDNYQYMGMQALASSLAARGGMGIARMIVHSLTHPKDQGPNGHTPPTKVSSPSVDGQK